MKIVRTEEEIDKLEEWVLEGMSNGSHFGGMSYEEGIKATLDWLSGRQVYSPADDE